MSTSTTLPLFPEITPYHHDWLQVDDTHRMYFEECGHRNGVPVLFLHGGPGSGCNPAQRRFFDPKHYRIILLDQRGCGRSTPAGATNDNNTDLLVNDIEALRVHLGITQWHVFGGSWGSTLALCYAISHANRVLSLVLRGIFLSRQHELDWFLGQVQWFFPEAWNKLRNYLPVTQRDDVLNAFKHLIFSEDLAVSIPAAVAWNQFESSIMALIPKPSTTEVNGEIELARARVQIHYIVHRCFVGKRDLIAEAQAMLSHIPTVVVQGRYDMVCPPQTAWELAQALPHAEFIMVPDAGHSAMETGTCSALIGATEKFKAIMPLS
jgi:proline iminopeptidase